MDLDPIYKTKLDESHQAGLQAVYDAGFVAARAAASLSFLMNKQAAQDEATDQTLVDDNQSQAVVNS